MELIPLFYDNTFAAVDLDAIAHNFEAICEKVNVPVMAVLKANGYGHGAIEIARLLTDYADFFGVSSVSEALELHNAGFENPILILGHTPVEAFPTVVEHGFRTTISSLEDAKALSQEACNQGKAARFHFAVDTGMSRLGFQPTEESADICQVICKLPGIFPEGLFSHFATADCADLTRAKLQADRFNGFFQLLKARGIKIPLRHMNNSAGLMNFENHYDMVRAGIVLYGLYPSDEVDPSLLQLKPALSWYSRVSHVSMLPAGREIIYGGTYVTTAPTKVATIPTGYADGYSRSLSGKFYVLIHGKKAPILGRICMDQMMVDVTHIPEIKVGDQVTLIGKDGSEQITVEQIAEAAGSFNYEFICDIGRRVPRYYVQNGQIRHTVHYLLDT